MIKRSEYISVAIVFVAIVGVFTDDQLMNQGNVAYLVRPKYALKLIIGTIIVNLQILKKYESEI